ncbi:type II toxin-antitoxin system VapC family toxin [Sphaerotilus sp.]|jgi:predicted nucleic acid-binding protein|uniref:type II toxin-antitoxin system VapC family toxin n=1 Tax=Sphaerotilus sp. TaxID=2093942 RepID=UPI00286D7049|nr:type II toxin-antitoxin system VapC family toxin [Sphaerotilus sp.]
MIYLDSSVLARLILRDQPAAYVAARELLRQPKRFGVTGTVLLELVWLLQRQHISHNDLGSVIAAILALPNLHCPDIEAVWTAQMAHTAGMDFADALHLAISAEAGATGFVTADPLLARHAQRLGLQPPVELLGYHPEP